MLHDPRACLWESFLQVIKECIVVWLRRNLAVDHVLYLSWLFYDVSNLVVKTTRFFFSTGSLVSFLDVLPVLFSCLHKRSSRSVVVAFDRVLPCDASGLGSGSVCGFKAVVHLESAD